MSLVLNEVQLIQNGALGAYLLHEFSLGFSPPKSDPIGIPLPLAFMVLPLVLHESTCAEINSTLPSSGLRLFQHKFDKTKDQLLNFHQRAIEMRALTLKSLQITFACDLLSLQSETAELWTLKSKQHKTTEKSVSDLGKAANRLGQWFATLSISEITTTLRIDL
jgi:hypothetical protein